MKKLIYYFAMAGLVLIHACKFKDDINIDPNNPRSVGSPATLITAGEVGFAYTYGGAFARFTSMFVNQVSGSSNQAASIDSWNF
jgi:hypothetical protein